MVDGVAGVEMRTPSPGRRVVEALPDALYQPNAQ